MTTETQQILCLAHIREAVGDPLGRLMQDELVERIKQLARIETAARKLFAVKGRHHSQIAMCDLGDLLGIATVRPEQKA